MRRIYYGSQIGMGELTCFSVHHPGQMLQAQPTLENAMKNNHVGVWPGDVRHRVNVICGLKRSHGLKWSQGYQHI